ncbi:MAG: hypothetical protein IJ347_09255 [Faecalibacterium sp.]|nr:hypothetical protein [Faecalibacterium sp.]
MYDFTGQQCPVCHQLFQEDADLVVCPDCGAPYHRECYAQTGHCLLQAKHAPDFEWTPPHAAKPERACPNCGAMNEVTAGECGSCAYPLSGADYAQPPQQPTPPRAAANHRNRSGSPALTTMNFIGRHTPAIRMCPRSPRTKRWKGSPLQTGRTTLVRPTTFICWCSSRWSCCARKRPSASALFCSATTTFCTARHGGRALPVC